MSQTNENILADSIAGVPHLVAFDSMVAARMNTIELEALLVYVVDSVSSTALPTLARQFDVEGFSGYGVATNDAQRRDIIKRAIELKRYMGTVFAIKEAMLTVGYTGATLIEGIDMGNPLIDWARFSIDSELGDTVGLDGVSQSNLAKLVREYKNVRSYLEGISYKLGIFDTIPELSDILNITYEAPTLDEDLGHKSFFYDGVYNYDGTQKYLESNDSLIINISNA
jgi:P2-related tail formation protein